MDTRTELFVLSCFRLIWLIAEYNDQVFAHKKELDAENTVLQEAHDLNPEVVFELFISFLLFFSFRIVRRSTRCFEVVTAADVETKWRSDYKTALDGLGGVG